MRAEATRPPIERRELLCLFVILLVAGVLRCAWPGRLAIEHFDEGVYASDVWYGVGTGQGYPFRYLYAPPLVPLISEVTLLFSGMAPTAPLWAGIVAGLLTVVSLWWIARCWWRPAAGLMAGALAGTSDVHAVFSRSALTDSWLLLWFVWAVYFAERMLRAPGWRNITLTGVLTGLAWWTKYNGWLPLAVAAGGLLLYVLRDGMPWRQMLRAAGAWLLAASLALLVWSPVLYGLQAHGGYAAVAANHRRYLVGFSGWLGSAGRNLANLRFLESPFSLIAGPLLVALVLLVVWRRCGSDQGERQVHARGERVLVVTALAAAVLWLGLPVALGGLTAGMLIGDFVLRWRPTRDVASKADANDAQPLGSILLAVWFLGLLLLTPLYYPYARLTLPWLASTWIGAAWALTRLADAIAQRAAQPLLAPRWIYRGLALTIVFAFVGGGAWRYEQLVRRQIPAWEDRDGLRRATLALVAAARRDDEGPRAPRAGSPELIVNVLGEPAVFFHLQAHLYQHGWPLSVPIGDLATVRENARAAGRPIYVIAGPHAQEDRSFLAQTERFEQQSARIATERFVPSALLLLDHRDARQLPRGERPVWELWLYRWPGAR